MEIVLIVVLAAATAFISAAETAFFALRRVDFARWKEEGNRKGRGIERMLATPGKLITTIFLVNELTNVSIASLIAVLLIPRVPGHGELLSLAAGTFVILILGDLVPKCLAWPRARSFSLLAAGPVRFLSRLLAPVRYLVEKAASGIVFVLGGGGTAKISGELTEREFRALVDVGEESGTLDAGEKELIHNIFEMTDRRAGEIMTPLADVFLVPVTLPYAELLARFRRYRRSRIPVYEEERQNIVGVLYFKELLLPMTEGGGEVDWRTMLKPPFVIPASKKLPLLLREFQTLKIHLALVIDEFGEFVGIVTLEDVLEELFGEIREEHDREEKEIALRPDGAFRVLGKTPIRRFNEEFGTDLPDQEWDTVAGLLLHEFGRLPGKGDSITLGPLRFIVERLKGIRITEVVVHRVPAVAE
jgi:CBS domain containing-hemolysin-like protein